MFDIIFQEYEVLNILKQNLQNMASGSNGHWHCLCVVLLLLLFFFGNLPDHCSGL